MKACGNRVITNRRNIAFRDLRFRQYAPSPLKRKGNHPIIGMDTETYKGTCMLLTDSDGEYIIDCDLEAVLSFLTRQKMRLKHNFFYNMDFDVQSMLKMLPRTILEALYQKGECEWYEYRIKYIPKKFFSITKGKHVSRFYDLYQFFESSLDVAAKKYLQDGKIITPFETEALNSEIGVWKQYKEDIIKYCIKDSVLCRDLGIILQKAIINEIKLTPQNYISRAGLSKHYFRNNAEIPDIRKIRKPVLRMGFYAYKGGRFEMLQKGHFDYVELYDIKSAYPYVIRNLIDVTKGIWTFTTVLNPAAHYGFYLCDVTLKYCYISPLPYVMKSDTLIYPFGSFRTVLTKTELERCLDKDEVTVIYGYEFYPDEIVYPFRSGIDALFEIKNRTDKDDYLYELTKRIMNSLYGAFYEKIKKPEGLNTGKMFNPLYVSIITADTRVKVYEFAKQYEKDVIAFGTDSVLFRGSHPIPSGTELGDWEKVAEGESVCIQSGLYSIENMIKTRGFKKATPIETAEGRYENIFEYIRAFPERQVYTGTVKRPIHLMESLLHCKKYTVDDVNVWMPDVRTLDINRDIKRLWNGEFNNGGELWERTINSNPLIVNDPVTQRKER